MPKSTFHTAALEYAARGWHVLPCWPGTKRPATSRGWRDASDDPARIDAWWAENPDYNVAIATGPSHLLVVDRDTDCDDVWRSFVASCDGLEAALESTYTVRTPSGGRHYYFTGAGRSTVSRLARGVDTRGEGGYIVAPPSVAYIEGQAVAYTAIDASCPVLCAPEALVRALALPEKRTSSPPERVEWDHPENISRASAIVRTWVETGAVAIEGEGGDETTYRAACRLLELGLTPETVADILAEQWNPHCIPPWGEDELRAKVENAWRYGQETRGGKYSPPVADEMAHVLDMDAASADDLADIPEEYRYLSPKPLPEAREGIQAPGWLLDEYLPETGVAVLFGPAGTFKTFLALDLALGLATGHGPNWFGAEKRDPMPVVYMIGESPHAFLTSRVDAWFAKHPEVPFDLAGNLLTLGDVPPLELADHWVMFTKLIKRRLRMIGARRPALLVVDTLSRAMVGWNINDARDAARAERRFRSISRELGCLVLVVHHVGKDENRGMVGSYIFLANTDTVIEAQRDPGAEKAVVLHVRKQKEADTGLPRRFVASSYGPSVAFERDHSALFDTSGARVLAAIGDEEWTRAESLIEALKDGPLSTDHLAASIAARWDVKESTVKRKLKKLASNKYKAWLIGDNIWAIPYTGGSQF